jgi:hypothetical protein
MNLVYHLLLVGSSLRRQIIMIVIRIILYFLSQWFEPSSSLLCSILFTLTNENLLYYIYVQPSQKMVEPPGWPFGPFPFQIPVQLNLLICLALIYFTQTNENVEHGFELADWPISLPCLYADRWESLLPFPEHLSPSWKRT